MGQVARTLAAGTMLAGAVMTLAALGSAAVGMTAPGGGTPVVPTASVSGPVPSEAGTSGNDAACGAALPASGSVSALYACIADELQAGYLAGTGAWRHADMVRDYPGWVPVAAVPAPSPAHGGLHLVTRVSRPGAAVYAKYAPDPEIPVGTRIAAESFALDETGSAVPGPLFLMEKVEYARSPETMGWYYMAVGPDGTPMGIDPWSDCNDCHVGRFAHQGGLGYPPAGARLRP